MVGKQIVHSRSRGVNLFARASSLGNFHALCSLAEQLNFGFRFQVFLSVGLGRNNLRFCDGTCGAKKCILVGEEHLGVPQNLVSW